MERTEMWIFSDDLISSLIQLAVFGCFTRIGSTFGSELIKSVMNHVKKKLTRKT